MLSGIADGGHAQDSARGAHRQQGRFRIAAAAAGAAHQLDCAVRACAAGGARHLLVDNDQMDNTGNGSQSCCLQLVPFQALPQRADCAIYRHLAFLLCLQLRLMMCNACNMSFEVNAPSSPLMPSKLDGPSWCAACRPCIGFAVRSHGRCSSGWTRRRRHRRRQLAEVLCAARSSRCPSRSPISKYEDWHG
jgi:hypothetical protein